MDKSFVECRYSGVRIIPADCTEATVWGTAIILGQPVYCGYIGKTSCCGSAEIWGGGLTKDFVHELLKYTKAGIIWAHWEVKSPWGSYLSNKEYIKQVESGTGVKDIFSISIEQLEHNLLYISLNILDATEYQKWMDQ